MEESVNALMAIRPMMAEHVVSVLTVNTVNSGACLIHLMISYSIRYLLCYHYIARCQLFL